MATAATASVSAQDSASYEAALLELKSRPAPARPGRISRPRLIRRLTDARDVPVALIVAPAGYGKTTLLSEWAESDGRPFAWVTLDPEDNDPKTLLSALAFALDDVEPVGWEVFEALASTRPDAATVALRRLVRSLSRRELPVVLALDDAHVVRTRESRQVLTAIWRAAGPGLQVALASRSDILLPVARMRALGTSIELRAGDLAMTRSEALAVLRCAGIELDREQTIALTRMTEGWPAGLSLAALALAEDAGSNPDVHAFGGDDRFVADYVHEEFLSGLSSVELDFLTRTSVLDRLSAPLCDAVLDRDDSARMLARLERSNALIVPLDRRRATYRYHELFADALRAELRRREPDQGALLHRRASAWCALHGDSERAVKHSIEGRDPGRAADLLWDSALQHAARGDQHMVWEWLRRFGDRELADTPLIGLTAAGTALVAGDLYEAERWTSLARTVPDDADIVRAGLALMRAGLGRHGMAEMRMDAGRALELLGERSPWRPLCLLFRGVALHLRGDVEQARADLEDGAHLAAVSAPLVQALCLSQLALLEAGQDDVERATVLAGRATAQVRRCSLDDCPTAALVFAVSAELRARAGQMVESSRELRHALRLLTRITDVSPWYEVEAQLVAACTSLRLGGSVAAAQHLDCAARTLPRTSDAPVLRGWFDQASAQLDLVQRSADGAAWSLTAAELRVLRYLPSHLSLREIAERLFVSPNTVKTHARGIYRKLDVSGRGHAVDRARAAGLVGAGLDG